MLSAFVVSQIFAAGTFAAAIVAYQCKNQRHVLFLLAFAQFCLSVHFVLLESPAAAAISAVAATRFFTGIWSKNSYLKYVFVGATMMAGVSMFSNLAEVLQIVGGILGTLAAFTLIDKHMRLYLLGGTVTNLLFNVILFSPVAIASGLFFLTSSVVGYWRFYLRPASDSH